MTQKLVFKNYQLINLHDMLFNLELVGTDSRMRTRFVQLVQSQLDLIEAERQTILTQYAKKDEHGELVKEVDLEGRTTVTMENKAQYLIEFNELQHEDFIVEVTPSNKQMIQSVTTSLLNAEIVLSGKDAVVYDLFCQIFEDIDCDAIV